MRVAALAALIAAATAAPALRVAAPALANGWFSVSLPERHLASPFSFTVVVQEQGIDLVKEIALNVSTPGHPQYGEFLSQDALNEITAPAAEDMDAVTAWLKANGMKFAHHGVSNLKVSTTVEAASKLFNTEFKVLRHLQNNRLTVRAMDFEIPAAVQASITTVLGLHGLPLPPRVATILGDSAAGAAVTPDVLRKTYGISDVKVSGSTKHTQAVAEFQGQFMNSTDLVNYFAKYETGYKVGTDDKVFKFVGKHEENSGGVEAELDIQFIMGVSVGVKTEFWEFPANDFCNDLNQWTSNLTAGPDTPIVHSVSYGWQGNLSQIGCHEADVTVVDSNFAKLAAKGVSIMISSGDSGSGYAATNSCPPGKSGVGIDGKVDEVVKVQAESQCCQEAEQHKAAGWTFVPHKKSLTKPTGGFNFKDSEFHAIVMGAGGDGPIHERDVFTLNGKLTKTGGTVAAKCSSGKCKGSLSMTFGPEKKSAGGGGGLTEYQRNVTFESPDMATVSGRALFIAFPGQPEQCVNIEFVGKTGEIVLERGGNPPPPPPPGQCTLYKTVTKHTTTNASAFSGFASVAPKAPVLWASWPASSPWVTAVGATRFVGHVVGAEEMASDQFGSGGGFSTMWEQSPDAKYQSAAVAKYLSTVDASTLPPAASFDAKARATPDVSALGEGYQVMVGGRVEAVGGTSASSPMFAGMVSLLNEARFAAGKKQMGFLNPFLYANEDAFTDIVLGSDKVGRGGNKLPYGFNCSKGWDPATGLGTPLFPKLLKAAMK